MKKASKDVLKKRRAEYNALKAKAKKSITVGKKAHYDRENAKIKKMPVKERKSARQKLKAELKGKQQTLLKQMPAAGRMKLSDIQALISKVKQVKW